MVYALRAFSLRRKMGSRSRITFAQRPSLESLERRELLATVSIPMQPDIPVSGSTIYATYVDPTYGLQSETALSGGNYLGTLNGTTALTTYSVDIGDSLSASSGTFSATVTTNGDTFGAAVPHASAIAWLLTNIGPTASTPDQQGALQAAIWRTEYGVTLGKTAGFQLDGADNNNTGENDATLIADYKADIAALGSHTAAVSSVDWITPTEQETVPEQGLVALASGTVEPFSLPTTNLPDLNYTYIDPTSGETDYGYEPGGNFLGTLNGSTNLTASYCLSITLGITNPENFNATVTKNASIYGSIVPNAGAIAWLVTNLGPSAISADQQNALQAAIWRVEYGSPGFELDGVDNNAGENDQAVMTDYVADLDALGSNTAPVSSVYWISPIESDTGNLDQGLVAVSIPTTATTTTVSSNANPAAYGQGLAFTATVRSINGATPTGSVQFQIDGANFGAPAALSGGVASISGTGLNTGGYSITATYLPQGSFGSSTSAAYGETVTADPTQTAVAPRITTSKRKKLVMLTATVANASQHGGAGAPVGTVEFLVDGTDEGTGILVSGKTSIQLAAKFARGKHKVTVIYAPGNGDFDGSSAVYKRGKKVAL